MLVKVKGIVLHTVRFRENSLIATLYTDISGRQSYMVKAIHKQKAVNQAGLFQPLYALDLDVYEKKNREIQLIRECKIDFPYQSIPFDIQKSTQALFLSEFLFKTLREEENNPRMFGFLENMLKTFDLMEKGKNLFHLFFLSRLTEHFGILPELNHAGVGKWFDMKKGMLVNSEPAHPFFMNPEISELFGKIISSDVMHLSEVNISRQQKNILLSQLIDYYHLHFETLGVVKSLPVLKELFQ